MAGAPYEAGGIRVTTEATRAAGDDELRALAAARRAEALRRRDHPRRDQVGLRARRRRPSAALRGRRRAHRRRHLPRRPRWSRPSTRAAPTTTSSSSAARCSPPARPHCRWIDVFCERGAFDADQSRAVLEAGRDAGLGLRVHGNQLGPGPGVAARGRAGRRLGRPLHLPRRRRHRGARRRRDGRHLPARRPTSRPASPTRTPAARSTPASTVAHRDQLQPRLELHDLDGVLHRARGPRPAHDRRRGAARRPRSAAPGRCAATTSAASRPAPAPTPSSSTHRRTPTSSTGRACRWWSRRSSAAPWDILRG